MGFISNIVDLILFISAALGALKVIARYTKWTWDDKAIDLVEAPFRKFISIFFSKGQNDG